MIVIDMPLPASCKECPFAREAGLDCIVFDRDDSETRFIPGKVFDAGSKPEWCPIIGEITNAHTGVSISSKKEEN